MLSFDSKTGKQMRILVSDFSSRREKNGLNERSLGVQCNREKQQEGEKIQEIIIRNNTTRLLSSGASKDFRVGQAIV